MTDDYAPWRSPKTPLLRAAYQVAPDWFQDPRILDNDETVVLRNPRPPARFFGITTPEDFFGDSPFRQLVDRWIAEQSRRAILSEQEKLEPLALVMLFGDRGSHMGIVAYRHPNGIIAKAELVDCDRAGANALATPQTITYIELGTVWDSFDEQGFLDSEKFRRRLVGGWEDEG